MLSLARTIASKDLRLALCSPGGFFQPLLLGLLLVFLFSLATPTGEGISPHGAATVFWVSGIFCQVLVFHELYALEDVNATRECLILAPAPVQGIWLGKALAGTAILLLAQTLLLPATIIFLNQKLAGALWPGAAALICADIGMAALGSMLGALAQGQTGRESLLSIVIFPLLIPLLLAAISLLAQTFGAPTQEDPAVWLKMAVAFDGIFVAAALCLFGFLYRGDE